MSHKRKRITLVAIIGLVLVAVGLTWFQLNRSTKTSATQLPLTETQIKKNLASKKVTTRADQQKSATATYQKATTNRRYTLANPYIKVNPYGTSPLTALVIFRTSQAAKVSYTVVGKSAKTSITNTVNGGYQTTHQVPIVGLYANTTNTVRLTVTLKSGEVIKKTIQLKTGALPKYVKSATVTVSKSDKTKMSIGNNKLTIIDRTTKEPFAIDADGNVRWYSTNYSQHTIEQWTGGHIMMLTKKKQSSDVYNDLIETDYLGRVYREYTFSGSTSSTDGGTETTVIHHDLIELPNHNLLATVSDGSKYKEDTMVEISHKTGKIVTVIDLKKLLPKSMWSAFKAGADGKIDWFHQNSIEYDKTDNSILISGRNQDMIMKIDYATKKIKWIYSGKKKASWPKAYRKLILTPTSSTTITGGQHGLTLLADLTRNASSENIMLYDNNTAVTNGDKSTSGKYSQAVKYHIDTTKMTITQTWAYGKSLGKTNFTNIIGYAEEESNGNVLIDFGMKKNGQESNVIEVDKNGNQVFNATIKNASAKAYAYRAYRVAFYNNNYQFDANKD